MKRVMGKAHIVTDLFVFCCCCFVLTCLNLSGQILFQKVQSAIKKLDEMQDESNDMEVAVQGCKVSKSQEVIQKSMAALLEMKVAMVAMLEVVKVLKVEIQEFSDKING